MPKTKRTGIIQKKALAKTLANSPKARTRQANLRARIAEQREAETIKSKFLKKSIPEIEKTIEMYKKVEARALAKGNSNLKLRAGKSIILLARLIRQKRRDLKVSQIQTVKRKL